MNTMYEDTPVPSRKYEEEHRELESIHRATLNILEDFDAEKEGLRVIQSATLNVLDDFTAERERFDAIQRATLNLLEDFDGERRNLASVQRATTNILEDFNSEKLALQGIQSATLNILEDFDSERRSLAAVQRATLNILEDFDEEKLALGGTQRATLNILEDFNLEKVRLEAAQTALLNILDDIDVEKGRVAVVNRQLEAANRQLEAANRELEAFSYSVSHDLRAPLRSVDGFSQALLEDYGPQLDARAQDYLRRIRTATQRMAQLIDDLLNLSRLSRGQLLRGLVDLTGLALAVTAQLQQVHPDRQVEVVIAPGQSAVGDARLLRLVLDNLLGNAWKFTAKHPQARIEFGSMNQEGATVYFVRDDGAGFDMTYAGKLFGAFQRLHSMEEFPGTGIGLATVQRIIRRHGGTVWAEGAVERGATFYFTL